VGIEVAYRGETKKKTLVGGGEANESYIQAQGRKHEEGDEGVTTGGQGGGGGGGVGGGKRGGPYGSVKTEGGKKKKKNLKPKKKSHNLPKKAIFRGTIENCGWGDLSCWWGTGVRPP